MTTPDLFTIGFLILLEATLSTDNALVLAMMVRHLPPKDQRKALTYGIFGAFSFRVLSLFFLTYLMKNVWVKFIGGGYLVFIAGKSFFSQTEDEVVSSKPVNFWTTVLWVELMDIAFSMDSILAAVAVSSNYFVVLTGGILGIVAMRFAASLFIRVLDRFPRFEMVAYQLVLLIGLKLILEGFRFENLDFHSSRAPAFWVFWGLMGLTLLSGFIKKDASDEPHRIAHES